MTSKCDTVITIPQFTGTCWFNALLMTLFYSDGMRSYLKKNLIKSELFKKNKKLYSLFMDILKNKYRKINNNDSIFFNDLKPENLLSQLNKTNSRIFYFNPHVETSGHAGEYYFIRLFEYFGLKNNVLFLTKREKNLYYSCMNNFPIVTEHTINEVEKSYMWTFYKPETIPLKTINARNTDILVLTSRLDVLINKDNLIITQENDSVQEILQYNGSFYKLDSLLVSNFNSDSCHNSHQIAGVTCENERYIYNGWIRNTQDKAKDKQSHYNGNNKPCELINYDWVNNNEDFCLSTKVCKIVKGYSEKQLCFNSLHSYNTTYIYTKVENNVELIKLLQNKIVKTRKDCNDKITSFQTNINALEKSTDVSIKVKNKIKSLEKAINKKRSFCDEYISELQVIVNDIENPTNSVYKPIESIKKPIESIKKPIESIKKPTNNNNPCPQDKVLNPKTNRCVSKTGAIGKDLLKNVNNTVNNAPCKENEIRNPKTNRCVSKTGTIGKELLKNVNNAPCPQDKVLNPKTNRCVSKTGAIGKTLV